MLIFKACCARIAQRWVFAVMGFSALLAAATIRICLSLAIADMVATVEDSGDEELLSSTCPSSNSTTSSASNSGIYDWDETLQGLILSSFFWGYSFTHIPGGLLAQRFGGKCILSLGMVSTAIFAVLTPVAVDWGDSTAMITLRVLTGASQGIILPAVNTMTARWAPPSERTKIGTLILSGSHVGTVLSNVFSGLLIQYSSLGWRSVFYVFGSTGIIWFLIFIVVCYNNPGEHPFISDKEKDFLNAVMKEHTHRKIPSIPWRYILTSVPLWALIIVEIGHDWGFYTVVADLPLYMSKVLKFSITANGYMTALPYFAMSVVSLTSSWLGDWLINSGKLSRTNMRKVFTTVGTIGPAVFMVAASYAGCDRPIVVTFFTVGMALMGPYYPGVMVNVLDLSPNYSGTLMAIVNGLGSLSGVATPYLTGVLTPNQTLNEWRLVFWIVFGVMTSTNVVYLIYASGEVQPWNDPKFLNREKEDRENRRVGNVAAIAVSEND